MQESSAAPLHPVLGPPDGLWRVRLLGGLEASSGDCLLRRFPGRPVALLLARLALWPQRSHAREELIELLWPEVALDVGRNRLRSALSTLRHLLEPPQRTTSPVLVADRQTIRINPGVVACDALEFERAIRAGDLAAAESLYRGELMPGYYDGWVQDERARLAALHERLTDRLTRPAAVAVADADPGANANAPVGAWPPRTEPMSRLPAYLSTFVGRSSDAARLVCAIGDHRLVTLTGNGGCGKTRLAVEVARSIDGFDAKIFVPLADCREGAQLADRVRAAAGLPLSAAPAVQQLATQPGGQRLLLVLDNFEQIVEEGGPEALAELLARLPETHAIVTSRRSLRLAGERELLVLPLPIPDADEQLADAWRNPSVALFVDRARGVRADFGLTAANRADLLRVCRALEGLPLALEIAAARIRTYSLRQMGDELAGRFDLLARSGAAAAREPRHASLHAAIDWSWGLLTSRQQQFLAALSVFRGGCSAADAGTVTASDDAHALLDALVADSLLFAEATGTGDEPRFRMLAVVREFVAERLAPERIEVLRRAHRACFMNRAMQLAQRHRAVSDTELENFVEALRTAVDAGEASFAVALALALRRQWEGVGTPPEVLDVLRRVAAAAGASTPHFSSILSMLALLTLHAGQPAEASDLAARAVAAAPQDGARRAEALFTCARVGWTWTRDGARFLHPAREALRMASAAGAPDTEARALLLVGAITLWHLEEPAEAESSYVRAAGVFEALGDPRGGLLAWHGRMACLQALDRHDTAIDIGVEREAESEALHQVEAQILFLNLLALSYEKTRRHALALDACRREARLSRRQHKVYNLAYALWNQCHYLARLRQPEAAAQLMAFSQKYWVDQFGPLQAADLRGIAKVRRLAAAQIGSARWEANWRCGLTLPVRDGLRLGCGEPLDPAPAAGASIASAAPS